MILVVDGDVRNNIITRTSALLSLEFALATAAYGIVYFWKMGAITTKGRIELISVCTNEYLPITWTHEPEPQSIHERRHVWDAFALPMTYLTWSTVFLMFTFIIFIWTSGLPSSRTARDIPVPPWSFTLVTLGILHPVCRSFQVMKTLRDLCQPVETPTADKMR